VKKFISVIVVIFCVIFTMYASASDVNYNYGALANNYYGNIASGALYAGMAFGSMTYTTCSFECNKTSSPSDLGLGTTSSTCGTYGCGTTYSTCGFGCGSTLSTCGFGCGSTYSTCGSGCGRTYSTCGFGCGTTSLTCGTFGCSSTYSTCSFGCGTTSSTCELGCVNYAKSSNVLVGNLFSGTTSSTCDFRCYACLGCATSSTCYVCGATSSTCGLGCGATSSTCGSFGCGSILYTSSPACDTPSPIKYYEWPFGGSYTDYYQLSIYNFPSSSPGF
jgi:hypothetical protein